MTHVQLEQDQEFIPWPKIARLNREVVVTEKIDGTNACIIVPEDGRDVYAQSRTRVIYPDSDNFGFAKWVHENSEELRETLGPGRHFGEWWGSGIQRGYGLPNGERRFSLFNVSRWTTGDDTYRCVEAPLCYVVPRIVLRYADDEQREDVMGFTLVSSAVEFLKRNGSLAARFMNPEGVVAWHKASRSLFKVTIEKDEEYKGKNG